MKKILFVEDEESLQKSLGAALEEQNYQVFRALDGEAGLSLAKKELPALILLDLILPKKNGFEVLSELKSDPSTKNIPIIVLTNLEGSADVERALTSGATTYLVKANYTLQDVIAKIEGVLSHSK
ncbi:MAG: response regulator [bacterium]|nr:response regulator [bacterium]